LKQAQLSATRQDMLLASALKQAQLSATRQDQLSVTMSATATKTIQLQELKTISYVDVPITPAPVPVPVPPPFIPFFFPFMEGMKQGEEKMVSGYTPYVREKGKWVKAGSVKPKQAALNTAADVADNSTAASIKVKLSKKKLKSGLEQSPSPQLKKFRKNKKGILIEKNKHRIDSFGERQGITAKGLLKIRELRRMGLPMGKKKKNIKIGRKLFF